MEHPYWSQVLSNPLPGRVGKPRIAGLTMVIDTGIPLTWMRDLLQMAAEHIDFWKFAFASASVYPPERVMDKITICQEYGVFAYPGGTSLEIAIAQGVWQAYLERLWAGGVRAVEVSDGTIDVPPRLRREVIRTAHQMGFTVLTEVGKKAPGHHLGVQEQARMVQADLNSGADYVLIEGRACGQNTEIYDREGNVREQEVQALAEVLGPLATRLIWEAPRFAQQVYYIRTFGNRVNLGNVRPRDVVALESLRRGLQSDTLRVALGLPEAPPAPPAGGREHGLGKSGDLGVGGASGWGAAGGLTLWTDGGSHRPGERRPPRRSSS
ncbi:phosphosulfolactate synthase [Alicyclobacillus cellulosilyticus]|uniref:Phosphosulfolactate synthase n=1 Tax=Alicyclobacillus cellulosilyticus TaxID=1003997 RepID=A0A917NI06_9BACL|nr:phosphosulfolactate synthase [Alicyclobacillus cellulosilyticus]GGJ02021.1 phosphosulfolactate synthase [Alicyclobacillus cellulosilyticus]